MSENNHLNRYITETITASQRARDEFYKTHTDSLIDASKLMAHTVTNGGKILIFGNGGSAADAQHLAAEMVGRMLCERKIHLPAMALTTDSSNLTAIANDYSYDDVFDFQLKAFGRPGDLAIAISTSGNSKNVLKAVESAKKTGMKVISFTGGSGGKLKDLSDISLNVALGKNASMIQETHITIVHLLVDLMDRFFLPENYVVRKPL
jgi:D-sedoheptulose 7-phosphate isomerase